MCRCSQTRCRSYLYSPTVVILFFFLNLFIGIWHLCLSNLTTEQTAYGQWVAMPCGWEGNRIVRRRTGHASQTLVVLHLRAQGLGQGDEHTSIRCLVEHG